MEVTLEMVRSLSGTTSTQLRDAGRRMSTLTTRLLGASAVVRSHAWRRDCATTSEEASMSSDKC